MRLGIGNTGLGFRVERQLGSLLSTNLPGKDFQYKEPPKGARMATRTTILEQHLRTAATAMCIPKQNNNRL